MAIRIGGRKNADGHTSMDNCRPTFIILLFGAPHILECAQRSQDASSDPDRVFSFRRCVYFNLRNESVSREFAQLNHSDLDTGRRKHAQFLLHTFSYAREHCASSRKDNVSVKLPSNIEITFPDGIVSGRIVSNGDGC